MSVNVFWNGSNYLVPQANETGWATPVTGILQDLGLHAVDVNTTQNVGGQKTFTTGITLTGSAKIINFISTGIDDNAVGLALTIDSSNNVVVANNLTVTGTFSPGGSLTLSSGNLSVSGTSLFTGAITATSNYSSTNGNITLTNGNLTLTNGTLSVGSITFASPLPIVSGGTGAATAANARTNLGLASGATTTVGTAATANTGTSGANVPLLNGINTWSAAQRSAIVTLTDGATVTPDFSAANNFLIVLNIAGASRTIANPSNLVAGQSGYIAITQDATGSRTITWGTQFKWSNAVAGVLSTSPNVTDLVSYYVVTGSVIALNLYTNPS